MLGFVNWFLRHVAHHYGVLAVITLLKLQSVSRQTPTGVSHLQYTATVYLVVLEMPSVCTSESPFMHSTSE